MRLIGVGDNVVDRYRALGMMFPGGNAVNVAVFASRLGASASYLGVVGNDEAGKTVLRSLRQESVAVDLVTVAEGPNAYADIDLVGTDRVFLGAQKNVAAFDPTAEHFEAMEKFDVAHTGYAGTFLPHVPAMAKRTKVSFDFGSRFALETAEPYLPHLYLAAFSSSHRSDAESRDLARNAVAGGATYALVTRGEEGAYLASARWTIHQDADRVQIIDTLGAGDAFIASVLVGLLAGRDRRSVLASASAHAAQVCMAHGAYGYGTPFEPTAPPAAAENANAEVSK